MENKLKIDVEMLMELRDTRRLALNIMTIEPMISSMDTDTIAKLNKILVKRFVQPVINYKFFDCPNCIKNCTDQQKLLGCTGFLPKRLNQVLIVDEDKEELDKLLESIANEAISMCKMYEGIPHDDDHMYQLIKDMAKAILLMNGKLELFMERMFTNQTKE